MSLILPSPRQNRVDPWGTLVATPERGLLMGNRGNLHDDAGVIVRDFRGDRWTICLLDFKNRHREIMQPGHYTELFFLDEATALAAGHRPCAECQRDRYLLFRDLWAETYAADIPSAAEIDRTLHAERWGNGQRLTYPMRSGDVPDGAIVIGPHDGSPYVRWRGRWAAWTFGGYLPGPDWGDDRVVYVLTPPSTVRVLAAGYPVGVHPSLAA